MEQLNTCSIDSDEGKTASDSKPHIMPDMSFSWMFPSKAIL